MVFKVNFCATSDCWAGAEKINTSSKLLWNVLVQRNGAIVDAVLCSKGDGCSEMTHLKPQGPR